MAHIEIFTLYNVLFILLVSERRHEMLMKLKVTWQMQTVDSQYYDT